MTARVSINGRSNSVLETKLLTKGTYLSCTLIFQPFSFLMICKELFIWEYWLLRTDIASSTCCTSMEQRLAMRSEVISFPTANKTASILFRFSSIFYLYLFKEINAFFQIYLPFINHLVKIIF